MALKHAILGLVIERPGYGYEIAGRVSDRCEGWGWAPTGVYAALDGLVREGQIGVIGEKRRTDTGRAAPRTIYEATPEGHDFFGDWVHERSPVSPHREELDLKIQLASPEHLPGLIAETLAQEQVLMGQVAALRRSRPPSGVESGWLEARALLQRNGEIKMRQCRIEWLQEVRRTMRETIDAPSA